MTRIQIIGPQPAHAGELRKIYMSATSGAPHCRFVPDVEHFRDYLLHPRNAQARIFVAEHQGLLQGFAALGRVKSEFDQVEYDAVTALFFAHEAAGQALLEACETHASGEVLAFPTAHGQCPIVGYNGGWDELSDRMPAVAQLLARNSYAPCHRELHLTCDLAHGAPGPSDAPERVELRESIGEDGQYVLHALIGEREAGVCHYITLAQMHDPTAARTGYIWWLHVEPGARRRGIARCLMLKALDHLRGLGCATCWLTTGADNWAAQPLYLALGFEIVDCSAGYRKSRRGGHESE